MTDHLTKLEQKIEVVQLMKESQQEMMRQSSPTQGRGSDGETTQQIKELMNNIYEQQKDLTDEMKNAIVTQSSVFVEKLRDTAAVQSNFYTETLKHTAKEMAQIMSNQSSKSLESICASFEEKLQEYTSIQHAIKESLDSAAKSVEVISKQQSSPLSSPVLGGQQQQKKKNQAMIGGVPPSSPRSVVALEQDPSSVAAEYTQDFESDSHDLDGGSSQAAVTTPKRKRGQREQHDAAAALAPVDGTKDVINTGTDSEAVSEIEEFIHYSDSQQKVLGGASESEIAEDIQEYNSGNEMIDRAEVSARAVEVEGSSSAPSLCCSASSFRC